MIPGPRFSVGAYGQRNKKNESSQSLPRTYWFGLETKARDAPWVDILEVPRIGSPWSCPPVREMVVGSDRFGLGSQSWAMKTHTPHGGAMRSWGSESFNPPECLFSCL